MVWVCGIGAPNATSSQGQPAMNTSTKVPDSIELQQEKQKVSKPNVDGENGSGLVVLTKGALSNILSNEAFQTHLKEIDMELEGRMHMDKGLHEGGADFAKVRLMLEGSNVVDISTGVMASFGST